MRNKIVEDIVGMLGRCDLFTLLSIRSAVDELTR